MKSQIKPQLSKLLNAFFDLVILISAQLESRPKTQRSTFQSSLPFSLKMDKCRHKFPLIVMIGNWMGAGLHKWLILKFFNNPHDSPFTFQCIRLVDFLHSCIWIHGMGSMSMALLSVKRPGGFIWIPSRLHEI